ncbi:MAG: hypothetical protein M3N14_03955 [Bacteroidota bacterium]|nr:hypothetical protein [Bacteroidota bacterium]
MKNASFVFAAVLLFMLASCKPAVHVRPEQLYGKWKYIKVENPNASPPDSVKSVELQRQNPNILFTKSKDLVITWNSQVLSHGRFTTDGDNIQYTESMPDGKKREFPFVVSKLTDKEIVFETTGKDGSRVTAVKEVH